MRSTAVAIVALGYVLALFGVGLWARRRVTSVEDFLVAGRRLPLFMAWPTLVATWFGAGTLVTATDEVRAHGLVRAALDPIGAGLCLFLAGFFIARRLWDMKLLTLPQFFGRRFGARAEFWSAAIMVPGYFGWIAAQFVALAGLLEIGLGIPMPIGIAIAAGVGMSYTVLGGMWSVTATDFVQMGLIVAGLLWLCATVFMALGQGDLAAGLSRLSAEVPAEKWSLVDTRSLAAFTSWIGVVAVGALGNLPGQDLTQRIFAARSARTAVWACHLSGASYLLLGALPLLAGLGADLLVPGAQGRSTLALLAKVVLGPWSAAFFMVLVMSAIFSTIESAILSPASVIAQNLVPTRFHRRFGSIRINHAAVVFMTGGSLIVAYAGDDAYAMLEAAYEVGLAALVVPLLAGLHLRRGNQNAALSSMAVGMAIWFPHLCLGWKTMLPSLLPSTPLPVGLTAAAAGLVAYLLASINDRASDR
jgi:Na+/proline symporter